MLDRLASVTWRHPRAVLAFVAAFVVLAGLASRGVEDHLKAAGFTDPASESEQAAADLRHALGYDANPGIVVIVRPKDGRRLDLDAPQQRREINRLADQLRKTDFVGHVVNPLSGAPGTAALIEQDDRSLVLSGYLSTADAEEDGTAAAADAARRTKSELFDVSLSGFAPAFDEVNAQTREDLEHAELLAFPLLAVLLLVVFRGVVAALVPLLIGVVSIATTLLVLRLLSGLTDTSAYALNITTTLSLGLAVDYALLLVSRYREELARSGPTEAAHRRMVQTAGRTVLFSGFTVAAAMVPLVLFPQRFLYSLGIAGSAVALISAVVAVVVVAALLSLLGARIDALSIRRGPALSDESGAWDRLARGVMRRPVPVATLSTVALLLLAAPLTGVTLTGPSVEAVPQGQPSYEPSQYLEARYPRSVIEAITVTVEGKVTAERLRRFAANVEDVPGITRPARFVRVNDRLTYANLAPPGPALGADSQDTVRALRDLTPPRGGEVLVSGNTARFLDQKASLKSHAPYVAAAVCFITAFLLFLLTGSVLLPIKTLIMNALTLAATLGVLVIGFQWGLLDAPLGYGDGPSAVEVTSLAFMIAVIFGLATDYAVLVMARIKELHDAGASNEEAVAGGIGRTGRVISAAAVMIAVVFLASAVSPVFFMKQLAVGLAVGVIIDATIVRALLVPSLMRLMGDWNWWAPAPLARFHARFGISEGGPSDGMIAAGPLAPSAPVVLEPEDLVLADRAIGNGNGNGNGNGSHHGPTGAAVELVAHPTATVIAAATEPGSTATDVVVNLTVRVAVEMEPTAAGQAQRSMTTTEGSRSS